MILGLAGDTMLGRLVGEHVATLPATSLVEPAVVAIAREADLFLVNLECCISERGERWPRPGKPFFFRAPPAAIDVLSLLGVGAVTLANNHALDYGPVALLDTFTYLDAAGITWVGAGPDQVRARAPAVFDGPGYRLTVLACSDHPPDYAATPNQPGVAWADLVHGTPTWLLDAVAAAAQVPRSGSASGVLVSPHWGPNMVAEPLPYVRRAAQALCSNGATLVAGHSAHVFHGIEGAVLYDVGDFIDDYATDPVLRNDLGLMFLVELDEHGPRRLEAIPLALEFCRTRLANRDEAAWITRRFRRACGAFGTDVQVESDRLVVTWRDAAGSG
jgi:poly-gamma-glutamate synthesis protein (capsule biosynthesis protein)